MAKLKGADKGTDNTNVKPIEQYTHKGKDRVNNPPVGLVTPDTDKETGKKMYSYDPHLDPTLVWAGKAEHTSFEVPTVSLHVHERIDPRTIIEAVQRHDDTQLSQGSLFETKEENPPIRQAIEFYKHRHNWSNRLIAGDSLLVMNSLLEKEGMAGHVQMVYLDPPYGIKYGSNFQPFVNKRDVKDSKDEDLTQEPETLKAFRDTWELKLHSYLTYMRDRILLARELLHESGSAFVQISDENVHLVRTLMDEVFEAKNFVALMTVQKTAGQTSRYLAGTSDYVIWYAKKLDALKYRQLFIEKELGGLGSSMYQFVELPDGERRRLTSAETADPSLLPKGARPFRLGDVTSQRQGRPSGVGTAMYFPVEIGGREYLPPGSRGWTTKKDGMERLRIANRLVAQGGRLAYVRYLDDFAAFPLSNNWTDTGGASGRIYVVQTASKVVERCLLMSTDPGDLVFDPTGGSATTASVAEQWGRRWITCDTSRVAITLGRQRLMTSLFDYYQLAQPAEGVDSGFKYKTVPHTTLKSIASNEPPKPETLYDQPLNDNSKLRVAGPFTVEAVPAPAVRSLQEVESKQEAPGDVSVVRSGETLRQAEWRDELFKTGIRAKGGQKISFSHVEPLPGTRWLHADAETIESDEQPAHRVVVSFGPEHQPLEQRQVALALEEAQQLIPKPKVIVFAAFEFDPEAAKDIDETDWPGVTLLKAKMNGDLFTEDLRKKRSSNESFWLVGQPDVQLTKSEDGKYAVEILGFDYYNTKTGTIDSGGAHNIAIWMLDPDYDGRSLFPRQVFFPMSGEKDGWSRLAKNLKAEIDEELIQNYHGTKSLPFKSGERRRAAVKIVDDRGIESLKLIDLD